MLQMVANFISNVKFPELKFKNVKSLMKWSEVYDMYINKIHDIERIVSFVSLLPKSQEQRQSLDALNNLKSVLNTKLDESSVFIDQYFDKYCISDFMFYMQELEKFLTSKDLKFVTRKYVLADYKNKSNMIQFFFVFNIKSRSIDTTFVSYTVRLECRVLDNRLVTFFITTYCDKPRVDGEVFTSTQEMLETLQKLIDQDSVLLLNKFKLDDKLKSMDLLKLSPKILKFHVSDYEILFNLKGANEKDVDRIMLKLNNIFLTLLGMNFEQFQLVNHLSTDGDQKLTVFVVPVSLLHPPHRIRDYLEKNFNIPDNVMDQMIEQFGNKISLKL
jgi:hypothetical protein